MSALRGVLAPYALTRILTAVVALAAAALFPSPTICPDVCHPSTNPLLDVATRWDSGAYLALARDGYSAAVPANNAYFPLFPFLMRALGAPFGGSDDAYLAAAVVVSNVALLVAVAYLFALVALDRDGATGSRAVLYLLVFPTSVFLAVVYPESLFLALAVGSVYHARRGDWLLAGALGGLAALTRPFVGAALCLPIAIEALRQSHVRAGLASAAVAPAALVAWLLALWRITGDPRAVLTAEESWGVRPALPTQAFADLFDPRVYGFPFFVLFSTIFVAVLVALSWRTLRPSLAAYGTIVFLVSVSTGSLTSAPRYYLTVFPAFMVLAIVAQGWVGRAYVAVGAAVGVILTAMFALWYWVA